MESPQQQTTQPTLVGFVSEPDGRGTIKLLFSCLVTLTLCVWSAVHLNLPVHNENNFEYTWRYIKWGLLGIFGPELVLWSAWRQYISARALHKIVKETNYSVEGSIAAREWTMVHGFYAGMGGFVFDFSDPDIACGPRFIPKGSRLHITPRGIQLLAECDLLPKIRREEIEDKSKTDASGKFICCIQAGWMLFQAATRLAANLPVTPLEINTIGHVLCALITFLLWWSKPRWIREPTIVKGEWARSMCAYMYMSSQVSQEARKETDILRDFGAKTEMSKLLYIPDTDRTSKSTFVQSIQHEDADLARTPVLTGTDHIQRGPGDERGTPKSRGLFISQTLFRKATRSQLNPAPVTGAFIAAIDDPTKMRQIRWQLACEAIERFPAVQTRLEPHGDGKEEQRYREVMRLYPERAEQIKQKYKREDLPGKPTTLCNPQVCLAEEFVIAKPMNWPGDDLINQFQGHLMGTIIWLASMAYGAVHLGGWHDQFPTSIESWMWRASALYIVFSGVLWSLLNIVAHLSNSMWWFWYEVIGKDTERPRSRRILFVMCWIGGSLYVIARLYLVVEAFVSLRALPPAAYVSPSWVLTVPHI